jgi:hypothetical protein
MDSRFYPRLLVPLTLALAACPPAPEPDAIDPLGGKTPMEVCLEFCPLCKPVGYDCEKDCAAKLRDATPVCERALAVEYACERDAILRDGCDASSPCGHESNDRLECTLEHGCYGGGTWCGPEYPYCYCSRNCKKVGYGVNCTPSSTGTGFDCECSIDKTPVGSCEQPETTELTCDIWVSCCNQYFPALQQ